MSASSAKQIQSRPDRVPKLRPTAVDYLLAGLSPALIIGMICCLVFFLLTVLYRGDFVTRLMYILGLYTFASVLISRIAIEQTRAVAMGYSLALGAATLVVVPRLVQFSGPLAALSIPLTMGFLILIGYLADRITHDCTLIDETQDSTSVGLLQSMGLVHNPLKRQKAAHSKKDDDDHVLADSLGKTKTNKKRKHNPGVWILYFAFLAVPLFGLGQITIPSSDRGSQFRANFFLFGYLFFAMALLATTSFLGLRRYLRQRQLAMPAGMAAIWIPSGMLGGAVLLAALWILPMSLGPGTAFQLPFRLESPDNLKASRFGWGSEGVQDPSVESGIQDSKNSADSDNDTHSRENSSNASGKSDQASGQGDPSSESNAPGGKKPSNGQGQLSQSSQSSQSGQTGQTGQSGQSSQTDQSNQPRRKDQPTRESQAERSKQPDQASNPDQTTNPRETSKSDQSSQSDRTEQRSTSNQSNQTNPEKKDDPQKPSDSERPSEQPDRSNKQPDDAVRSSQGDEKPQADSNGKPPSESRQRAQPRENGQRQSSPPTRFQAPSITLPNGIAGVLRWLLLLVLIGIVFYYLIRHRADFLAFLRQCWDWWYGRSGKVAPLAASEPSAGAAAPARAFRQFLNPFASGSKGWTAAQLIGYLFEAIEAWGRERSVQRLSEETAEEYLRRLAGHFPEKRESWLTLIDLYNRSAYAATAVELRETSPLANLWTWLTQSERQPNGGIDRRRGD
jgi:hypothetical protein